jgi:Transcriptional regulator PadR-like family
MRIEDQIIFHFPFSRNVYEEKCHPMKRPHFAVYLWTFQREKRIFYAMSKGKNTEAQKSEVLQGTLDLMVLKVIDALAPQHEYGIARRIEQVSGKVLQLNEGTVYTSLLRLQQRG